MQDLQNRAPAAAGWWTRLPDGSIRRVLSYRAADTYVCLREICTPVQEAARLRLANQATQNSAAIEQDRALVAQIRCDILRTPDLLEAYFFLGADNSSRSALIESNPTLALADFADFAD